MSGKNVRILNVLIGYLPAVSWGGPITVVQQNATELQRRGHDVTVCASNRLDRTRSLTRGNSEGTVGGIRVVYLSTKVWQYWSGTVGPTMLSPAAIRRLWEEVGAADVVHVHGSRNIIVLLAALFARVRNKALVVQPHGTASQIVSSIKLKRLLDPILVRPMLRSARAILALTPAEREQIIRVGGSASKVEIVANGIAPAEANRRPSTREFRDRFSIPERKEIVLFLGRINPKKGADILARAFVEIRPDVRDQLHLVFAGPDDGHLESVRAIIREAGLEANTTFTGPLDQDTVLAAHDAADIFVLPCRTDTFPMTIIEACRAGTPVVISNTCEIADIIADTAGLSVAPEPAAVAAAISTIHAQPEMRRKFAAGAAELVRTRFSIAAATDRMEAVYAAAIA